MVDKWEYRVIQVVSSDVPELNEQLSRLGDAGFELVTVLAQPYVGESLLFLKRRVRPAALTTNPLLDTGGLRAIS